MKLIRAALIGTAIVSTAFGASAAVGLQTPWPGAEDDYSPWQLLIDTEDAAAFVYVTGRVGNAATAQAMVVFRNPVAESDDAPKHDAFAEGLLIDCGTMRYESTGTVSTLNGVPNPPALVRIPNRGAAIPKPPTISRPLAKVRPAISCSSRRAGSAR